MTHAIGDPGHVTLGHNDLAKRVNDQLERFGLGRQLREDHQLGDAAHIDAHAQIVHKLAALAAAAGQSFTVPLPPNRALGDTGHTDDHNTLEANVTEAASWPAWNSATGGVVTEYDNYNGTGQRWRVHVFESTAVDTVHTLTIAVSVKPWRILLAAGAGSGGENIGADGSTGGSGGGGGVYSSDSYTLTVGAHSIVSGITHQNSSAFGITVGYGGNGAPSSNNHTYQTPGEAGFVTGYGSGGVGGGGSKDGNWNSPGNGIGACSSNITGTMLAYGLAGGVGHPSSNRPGYRPGSGIGGKNAGKSYNNYYPSSPGCSGSVIVAYQIG